MKNVNLKFQEAAGRFGFRLTILLLVIGASGCEKAPTTGPKTSTSQSQPDADAETQSQPDANDQLANDSPVKDSPTDPGPPRPTDGHAASTTSPGASNSGWHVFRGNALSSGVSYANLPTELETLWEYKAPGSNAAFEGTAVIAKHSKTGQPMAYIGDLDGRVFAFDLETGDLIWQMQPEVTLPPSEYATNKEPRQHKAFSFTASPAFNDGRIFIGDTDGIFYCLDESGELKWFYQTETDISSSANFYDGGVLIGSQDANLYLLDTATGEERWKFETPDQIRCSITVADDRAFVAGCDGFFHVVDLKTGEGSGKVDIKSPTQSTPAVLGDQVFFGTEQDEFVAIDWKAAQAQWTFADEDGPAPVRGCAAVVDGHVVFGARNRFVYCVDPDTGNQIWAVELKSRVDSSPVIVGSHVYVGSTDGRFYVLSLENGDKIWEKQFKGGFTGSPAVAFDRLVVATDRGVVYCLGKSNQ